MSTEKEQAISLRLQGFSLNEIYTKLKKPKTTVWGWICDVQITENQAQKIKSFSCSEAKMGAQKKATAAMVKKYKKLELDARAAGRAYVESFDILPADLVSGVMLYWGEGRKESVLRFSNSDKHMMKVFMNFAIKHMFLKIEKIKVELNFYDNVKTKDEVEKFWLDWLGLDKSSMYKSQINNKPNKNAGKNIGKLPYGVCSISYNSRSKLYEMQGMLEAVRARLEKDN